MRMTCLGNQWYDHMKTTYCSICINMTNEELIEELYHKAHTKGFFDELHDKVNELKTNKTFKCRHEMVRTAYNQIKELKLAQPPRTS